VELADRSAWTNRHKDPGVDADFDARLLAGEIATCPQVTMELLWTAQSPQEFEELREDLAALPQVPVDGGTWQRAIDVWHELVRSSRHRQAKIPDLLVAAAAEIVGMPVCHYAADFEAIADVTGQPVRAIAPLGSLRPDGSVHSAEGMRRKASECMLSVRRLSASYEELDAALRRFETLNFIQRERP